MTPRDGALRFGGVAPPDGSLAFRVATGVFDLPPLPAGETALAVRLETEPGLQVLFELLDPEGRLRLQVVRYKGGPAPEAVVSSDAAESSLNARPGPLLPGRWTWRAAVRNVSPLEEAGPRALRWSCAIGSRGAAAVGTGRDAYPDGASLGRTDPPPGPPLYLRFGGAGWVAGDLHQHTTLSDGTLAPDRLLSANHSAGHAFLAVADHQVLQPPRDLAGAAVLGGVEVTSPSGHFLRIGPPAEDGLLPDAPGAAFADCADLERLRARFRAEGALLVLCHPCFPPWHWRCGSLSDAATPFDAVEVLCDPTHPRAAEAAEAALALWTAELERGVRLVGLGGSDFHGPTEGKHAESGGTARPGDPATFVRCEGPSPDRHAVLAALRAGRAAVGRGFLPALAVGPSVPGADPDRLAGDVLRIPRGDGAALAVRAAVLPAPACAPAYRGELVGTGGSLHRFPLPGDGTRVDLRLPLPDRASGWLRLDVRDADGRIAGFTNPVFWTREEARP